MEQVKFHFDPRCPWCYQTSRWAKKLEDLGEIKLDWGVFCLEVVNAKEGTDLQTLDATSGPALRTVVALRNEGHSDLIRAFYTALGKRIWETVPPEEDNLKAVHEALEEIGLDPALCDKALADPSTWDAVLEEHAALVERTRSFGVPTIVLDNGEGPAIFGPVIGELPNDEDAVELWRHVSWLARYGDFSELKRDRVNPPNLPAMEWRMAQRANKG